MWRDIINAFKGDDLYTQALRESHAMLDMDLEMFEASIESLRYSDTSDVSIDIYSLDKKINAFERDVRKKVMMHLTVSGPGQLSSGLVLVSIVVDIERIGDYSKNISDLARCHPTRLEGMSLEPEIVEIEGQARQLFRDTVDAFKNSDVDKSREIMTLYKGRLSAHCDDVVDRIVRNEAPELGAGNAAAIALYVRYLKRISSHSRNIVTSIVNPFHRIGYKEKQED